MKNDNDPRRILQAAAMAFAVAMLLLLGVVMPAEFGRDPLGVGRLTGIDALSRPPNPFQAQAGFHGQDYREFHLGPFESVEYKYLMDAGAPLLFGWSADGELYYDMHAEPAGLGPDYARSFEQGDGNRRMGSYHAPFAGIHGWFWENRGDGTVLLRLHSAGFYHTATVFRDGGSFERVTEPVEPTER